MHRILTVFSLLVAGTILSTAFYARVLTAFSLLVVGAILGTAFYALAATARNPAVVEIPQVDPFSKPCMHAPGGWITIETDNLSSTSSAKLNDWSRYTLQCQDDTHIAWGDADDTTDIDDGTLPIGSWYTFGVEPVNRYVHLRNANFDSTCKIIECR